MIWPHTTTEEDMIGKLANLGTGNIHLTLNNDMHATLSIMHIAHLSFLDTHTSKSMVIVHHIELTTLWKINALIIYHTFCNCNFYFSCKMF